MGLQTEMKPVEGFRFRTSYSFPNSEKNAIGRILDGCNRMLRDNGKDVQFMWKFLDTPENLEMYGKLGSDGEAVVWLAGDEFPDNMEGQSSYVPPKVSD